MSKFTGVIAITGPTASGKSGIAMELAERFGGEIISGDSMQIYKGMDIGTAKPTADDMKKIKHHLIDQKDIFESFSVNDYCTEAHLAVKNALANNKLPIICGGTGQYIQWFLSGLKLTDVPSDMKLREQLEKEYDSNGAFEMHLRLKSIDPISADAIHPNNKKRLVRALEIYFLTGKTKTFWDAESKKTSPPFPYEIFVLEHEREILYQRINDRVDVMRTLGLTEEVLKLYNMGLEKTPTASQAIGYKEFFPYFKSEITENDAYNTISQSTRNYAKRQITFFKRIEERKTIYYSTKEDTLLKIVNNSDIIKNYV